ncbi:MAG: hypothetical protein RIC06_14935 [Cyclobacteriaceae bacterium]
MKKHWFTGSGYIESDFQNLKKAIVDHGKFYEGVTRNMSGITGARLLEQGASHLSIETNEGIMNRTSIKKEFKPEVISIAFDEEYKAGKIIKVSSHFLHEFTVNGAGIKHHITISDVRASGVLGFFYRVFARNNIGKILLGAHKRYLEELKDRDV